MGRKKLNALRRRSEITFVRLSPAERELLERISRQRKVPMAHVLREAFADYARRSASNA